MTDVNVIPVEGDPPEGEEVVDPNVTEFTVDDGDSFFAAVMGSVEAEPDPAAAGEGGAAADAAAGGDGSPAAPAEGAPAAGGKPAAPATGADGKPAVAGAADGAAVGGATSEYTRDAADLAPNWTAAIEGLEKRQNYELTLDAVNNVKTEFAQYIDAVEAAPRYLVGKTVPKADGSDGEERLNDAQDARDWQEEIKKQLAREVQSRVRAGQEANKTQMELLHNSIELFRGNPDLVPRTKQFDKELADQFSEMILPYAVRTADGKIAGWNIDVRPMLVTLRQRLTAERAKAPAAPAKAAEPTAQQQRAAQQQRTEQGKFSGHPADNPGGPQAGIQSQAGTSGDDEGGLDTLFGTLGFAPGTFRF